MNRPPAEVGMALEAVETPALLLDMETFERNLARPAAAIADPRVRLRPHAKTHKSPAIALRQMAHGAVGVGVQKVSEAEAMLQPRWAGAETPVRATIDQILETVAGAWEVDPQVLRAPMRLRRAAQARAAAAHIVREVAGQPLTALARAVGRDVASLSIGLRRLEAARVDDVELSRRLAAAVSALRSGARPHFRRRKP